MTYFCNLHLLKFTEIKQPQESTFRDAVTIKTWQLGDHVLIRQHDGELILVEDGMPDLSISTVVLVVPGPSHPGVSEWFW